MPEYEVRRILASADLSSAQGRDRALELVCPVIATVPAQTASRDELVRMVADRLDIPASYITARLQRPSP